MMSSPAQVVDALGSAVDTATNLAVPESPQTQIDNLQKLVNVLMQKLKDQEDSFELERLTWEAGDEHQGEEQPEPPVRRRVQLKPDLDVGDGSEGYLQSCQ